MCWSTDADLVAGTVIVGLGVAGVTLARHRRDVPLAALPVLLGIHQLVESRVWADSPGTGAITTGAVVTVWVVIAFAVLPAFVPLALLRAERQRNRGQYFCALVGLAVSGVMIYAVSGGTHASNHGHVMDYGADIPFSAVVVAGYLVATILPFLLSPEPTMRELGIALIIGAALAAGINIIAFSSIWCAFAAVVSVLVIRRTVHASANLSPSRL